MVPLHLFSEAAERLVLGIFLSFRKAFRIIDECGDGLIARKLIGTHQKEGLVCHQHAPISGLTRSELLLTHGDDRCLSNFRDRSFVMWMILERDPYLVGMQHARIIKSAVD